MAVENGRAWPEDRRPHAPTRPAPLRALAPTGSTTSAPKPVDALVVDANLRQALLAVRALGRTGLTVGVAESQDECKQALGVPAFTSKWSAWHRVLPGIANDPGGYACALFDLVREHPARVLIPSSDASIAALRPWRTDFEKLGVSVALASEPALDVANDKQRTMELAAELGIPYPRSVEHVRADAIPAAVCDIGYPAVVKPVQSWVRCGDIATRVGPQVVTSRAEAVRCAERLGELGCSTLVQQWVGGSRESVDLIYARGRVYAEFAQVAYRMTPVLGGVAVVRESIPMPDDIRHAAVRLVHALDLEGYCEVEFRRDDAGRPLLMEINARLTGGIEVAVRSGVDFPTLLWRWAAGEALEPVHGYRPGVRMRNLHSDVKWLVENMSRQGLPDSTPRLRAVATFAAEFLRRNAYDYVDRGDLRPAWRAFTRDAQDAGRRLVRHARSRAGGAAAPSSKEIQR